MAYGVPRAPHCTTVLPPGHLRGPYGAHMSVFMHLCAITGHLRYSMDGTNTNGAPCTTLGGRVHGVWGPQGPSWYHRAPT